MKKSHSILVFCLFVLAIVFFNFSSTSKEKNPANQNKTTESMDGINTNTGHPDLLAFSIVPGARVHGILSYRGVLKGGYFFEGNVKVFILDANKNVLKSSNAISKTDWMTAGPVQFEGNIDFTGLTPTAGYFRIANDNPSGDAENDKVIDTPIIIE